MRSEMSPSSVRIGPQTYKIEFRDPAKDGMLNDGNYGYTLEAGNLIVVSKTIDISKQRITLMHEILHACKAVFEGYAPKKESESKDTDIEDIEHALIAIYENSLIMIFKDNPELIEWLSEED
jgi:Zn-dependent peptidase ImmA (M78 family)